MIERDLAKEAKERAEQEAQFDRNREAYHAHPSHPSSCLAYTAHYGQHRRCPCESYEDALRT